MTVRVNKSAFNIREKLTELGRRFGRKGSELIAAETAQDARDLVSAGRRNMIINGEMNISQRVSDTETTITNDLYSIDRYQHQIGNNDAVTTVQQTTDVPPGFKKSLKITVTTADSSVATNHYHYIRQIIEGNNIIGLNWGTSSAKPVTLSFWTRSSVTGTHGGSLFNDGFDRSFPFEYTIKSADTWEYKSITIPGCPDGTWRYDSGRGISVEFSQGVGTDYTGTPNQWNSNGDLAPTNHVNLVGTLNATWYITGLQLEIGKNATEFEHRLIGEEFTLCQRYCQRVTSSRYLADVYRGSNGGSASTSAKPLPVRMRDNFTTTAVSRTMRYFTTINSTANDEFTDNLTVNSSDSGQAYRFAITGADNIANNELIIAAPYSSGANFILDAEL